MEIESVKIESVTRESKVLALKHGLRVDGEVVKNVTLHPYTYGAVLEAAGETEEAKGLTLLAMGVAKIGDLEIACTPAILKKMQPEDVLAIIAALDGMMGGVDTGTLGERVEGLQN